MRSDRTRRAGLAILLLLAPFAAACSSSDDAEGDGTTTTSTRPAKERPDGPAADLSAELSGGNGVFIATAAPDDVESVGYEEHEYAARGTAALYTPVGELGGDGKWTLEPGETAPYTTRVLIRTPADPDAFSGTVIVELLNVSAGVDAEPEWSNLHEELTRSGDAWVGVSAQAIGVEGGAIAVPIEGIPGSEVAGTGLKVIDPERYGSLDHPGDAFAFDIFTQVARAVRDGDGLGGLEPDRLLAAGQSQSGFAMVTYANGVQPLTQAFDGFFVHSRGSAFLPLVAPGESADIEDALKGPTTTFRDDLDVPVMDIQTETDVTSIFGSAKARQPDTDGFRLWEIVGTAHADQHTVGESSKYIDCGVPINDGPTHVVAKAAFHALKTWVIDGTPPPMAPLIEAGANDAAVIQRDADGIALGGLRTPPVDVPVAELSGAKGPVGSVICLLLGSTLPFTPEQIAARYDDAADYTAQYEAGVDAAIEAGFVLEADREALLDFADPDAVAAGVGG